MLKSVTVNLTCIQSENSLNKRFMKVINQIKFHSGTISQGHSKGIIFKSNCDGDMQLFTNLFLGRLRTSMNCGSLSCL